MVSGLVFDPIKTNPMLNPNEIVHLFQITIKHFDFLPTKMKEYCLDNLSVFNIERFDSDMERNETTTEHTTAPTVSEPGKDDCKLKFIARLNEVISIFNSDSDFLDGLWYWFDPKESNPILNPDEIVQLVQITIKHFDFLPTQMKEYCLENLSVFNIEKFNEQ